MTRIIAGQAGSLRLEVPQGPTRPTSERVREAMFSAIEHLVHLDGARVLDLYAGSGALGLEAASRGATHVTCVDSSKKVRPVLASNIAKIQRSLGEGHTFLAVTSPSVTYCENIPPGVFFDLVMMDPPYDVAPSEIIDCLEALGKNLSGDSLVVVERAKKSQELLWPESFQVIKEKTYGDTVVFLLTHRR